MSRNHKAPGLRPRYETVPMLPGRNADIGSGELIPAEGWSISCLPVRIPAGSLLEPVKADPVYRLFAYGGEPDPELIYTYCYSKDGCWLPYEPEKSTEELQGPWRVAETCYFRIAVKSAEGGVLADHLRVTAGSGSPGGPAALSEETGDGGANGWMNEELLQLQQRLQERSGPFGQRKELRLLLLADTHFAVGGIWEDTLESLRLAREALEPEGIIHLGDLTDGMYPMVQTRWMARIVLDSLTSLGLPLWLCLGNHDENYFRGSTEVMDKKEAAAFYLGKKQPFYRVDLPAHRLRIFFLDSFQADRKERYGFSLREWLWFCRELLLVPRRTRILICSHVTPLVQFHVWSSRILHSRMMRLALRYLAAGRGRKVLGWIHGHSHADQVVDMEDLCPVIGIGCGKLESFTEHKPEGSVTPERKRGTGTQELWDLLVIPDEGDSMELYRYGAGDDRYLEDY